jgi:hypothetical protein
MTDKFKMSKPGEVILEPKPCPEYVSMNKLAPKSTNPKDRIGMHKPPLHLIPGVALVEESMAFKDGAEKYGPYNWRDEKVSASIYVSAALRHLHDWYDGQECASDSGRHHLAHARACLGILLDAQSIGQMVDDRPKPGKTAERIEALTVKKTPAV